MTLTINTRTSPRRVRTQLDVAGVATLAVVALGAMVKLTLVMNAPLWLDEVWTGVIASQRTFSGFIHQCYVDINAPLDYVVSWACSIPAGLSNEALRFPSRLFASVAPLVTLTSSRSIDRTTRLVWCGLMACWLPGLFFAIEARCYPLVFILATSSTVAFAGLMSRPSSRVAWTWTILSSLLILAHYVSGLLVVCQGVAYLAVHRTRALKSWPAALAFLPAFASLAAHATLILGFSSPSVTHPAPLRFAQGGEALTFLLGSPAETGVIVAWGAVSLLICSLIHRLSGNRTQAEASGRPGQGETGRRPDFDVAPRSGDVAGWIVPSASLAAVLLCFLIWFWRPIVAYRYLTPMAPGILLGVAMIASHFGRIWRISPAILVGLCFGIVAGQVMGAPNRRSLYRYEFETASDALMTVDTRHLVFMWDITSAEKGDPEAFGQVGGFFFKRAGRVIPVTWAPPSPRQDPNIELLAQATAPGTAIIWLYDATVPGTEAARFPPRIEQIDPRWGCHDFGAAEQHVLACSRDWASKRHSTSAAALSK